MPTIMKEINDYLKNIKNEGNDPKALATSIQTTIYEYIKDRNEIRKEGQASAEPDDDIAFHSLPDFSELLYAIKEKTAEIALEGGEFFELGLDKHSKFIKEFLDNPINALTHQCDLKIEYYKLEELYIYSGLFDDNNKDYQKLINDANHYKNEFKKEKKNYNDFAKDKDDKWKERQKVNSDWFIYYFNNGQELITEKLEQNKGGFFENFFGTTSAEYKEFARRLGNISKDGPEKGDLQGLSQAALAYLCHKFKKGNFSFKDYALDEKEIEKMDATSQGRVRLCLDVLDAIREAEEAVENDMDPKNFEPLENKEFKDEDMYYGAWLEAQNEKNNNVIKNEIIDEEIDENIINTNKNVLFQNQIKKDLEDKLGDDLIDISNNDINLSNDLDKK